MTEEVILFFHSRFIDFPLINETHSMLNRMVTLYTQAANGTYSETKLTARTNIGTELARLNQEIDRIAKQTDFNGIKPLEKKMTMTFQIGPSGAETIVVDGGAMDAGTLGVKALTTATNYNSVKDANKAIDVVNKAINTVSDLRAKFGAAQNRLEHTINSLQVSSENITAAESRIRDTDMADEITKYTKNNILLQAAQSMLSQANATPQGVLSMLQ